MLNVPQKWDVESDVVVVGSGAAGLTAAIVAHDRGATVTVLERSDKVGGASACSGGMAWVPLNHHMGEIGIDDSKEDAMTYLRRLADGFIEDSLLEAFLDNGHNMVRYLEENTPVRFEASALPDYRSDLAGSRPGGRGMNPKLFNINELGEWADNVRQAPQLMSPMTIDEAFREWDYLSNPSNLRVDILLERMEQGLVGMGMALISSLYKGLQDRSIDVTRNTRAKRLIVQDGAIIGLQVDQDGRAVYVRAKKAVVLACGGFEWNPELQRQFLTAPIINPITPPFNEGDGLKMAMEVGAQLACMPIVWWLPSIHIPGEEYEGRQLYRTMQAERTLPHTICVNRQGKRFANEAINYDDMGKAMCEFDLNEYDYANYPTWIVFDSNYREKYMLMTIAPGDPDPDWLDKADTLAELAKAVGIDPQGLEETVKRFNTMAVKGVDEDFQRGENLYDFAYGDSKHKPNPCLGPIEKPPFYVIPLFRGALGTKGGPKVNTKGQVLNPYGEVIPGLYTAGNMVPGVTGRGYGGFGGTLGPGMTFGYIAAKTITEK